MNKFNVFFNYMKTKTIETIKNMLTLQFYVLKIRHLKMMFIFIYGDFLGLKLCQGGHRGRDRTIVGYIITNAISAYHH